MKLTERWAKYIKAVAAVAACVGIVISPEQQENILVGFGTIYAIVVGSEGRLFKK